MNKEYQLWVCFSINSNQYDYQTLSVLRKDSICKLFDEWDWDKAKEQWKSWQKNGWRCEKVTVTINLR